MRSASVDESTQSDGGSSPGSGGDGAQSSSSSSSSQTSGQLFRTKNMASLVLIRKRAMPARMDVVPFVAVYACLFYVYANPQPFKDWFVSVVVPSSLVTWSPFLTEMLNIQVYTASLLALWACVVMCFVQLLLGLLQYWHNSIQCLVQFERIASSSKGCSSSLNLSVDMHAYIVPPLHCGEDAIVPVQFDETLQRYFVDFQSLKYIWNPTDCVFEEIVFPISKQVSYYLRPRVRVEKKAILQGSFLDALNNNDDEDFGDELEKPDDSVEAAMDEDGCFELAKLHRIYGENEFKIPVPQFLEIFQTHLTAPFFLFQLFCVALWCLDDYWMYSLFTLFMLVTFEVMTVKRRMGNMSMIRNMRTKPYSVWVYRSEEWIMVQTTDIVPNDIVSISRTPARASDKIRDDEDGEDYYYDEDDDDEEEQRRLGSSADIVIPCDALLLRGTCVVDEALLTGESVPQIKEPLDASDGSVCIDLKSSVFKSSLVSGGTKVVLTDSSKESNSSDAASAANNTEEKDDNLSNTKDSLSLIPIPPDCGAVCYVIRTGFNTCQGELLRTILFSTSRVSVNNPEAFYFLLILLCFAMCFASYVLYWSLQDETRSYFKIALNVISILTSVVPPELPMELSLAVNNSLLKLMQFKIFCTEAFRIPFAGALDVCCFDKTGTLTSDSFQVVGCTRLDAEAPQASIDGGSSSNKKSDDSAPSLSLPSLMITDGRQFTEHSTVIIAGCHSLVSLSNKKKRRNQQSKQKKNPQNIEQARLQRSLAKQNQGKQKKKSALVVGDPLEQSALNSMGWQLCESEDNVCENGTQSQRVKIWHRFAFSSALKRMSCVVSFHNGRENPLFVSDQDRNGLKRLRLRLVCKGAAEEIGRRLKSKPRGYDAMNGYFSRRGFRVLALAWRMIEGDLRDSIQLRSSSQMRTLQREKFECSLNFAGFLVFATPHKPDSMDTILQLRYSSHAVVMITGDHWLTACAVARDLKLVTRPIISLCKVENSSNVDPNNMQSSLDDTNNNSTAIANQSFSSMSRSTLLKHEWVWRHFEDDSPIENTLQLSKIEDWTENYIDGLVSKYSLCLTGDALSFVRLVLDKNAMRRLVVNTAIYARTSPQQKEYILSLMKSCGLQTLMCGDGTNDVGALKQSHVGVALLSESAAMQIKKGEKRSMQRKKTAAMNKMSRFGGSTIKRMREMQMEKEREKEAAKKRKREKELEDLSNPESVEELQKKLWAQLMNGFEDDGSGGTGDPNDNMAGEMKPVQLGDASIAAPFTSKLSSIESCLEIVKEGRCTLVTTLQMFSILALNALITGYSLTLMYTDGIKYGDTQMTITGMLTAALFFFITRSEATVYLSKEKPHTSVFTKYLLLSLFGQAMVHLSLMYYCVRLSKPHTPTDEETRDWRGKFKPNVLNTVVFLVSTTQTVASFLANYAGYPFMTPLMENKKLWRISMALVGICFSLALNWFPEWSTFMQCATLPSEEFRSQLVATLTLDLGLSIGWERFCRAMFRTSAIHRAISLDRIEYPNRTDEMKGVYQRYRDRKKAEREENKQPGFWDTMKENMAMAQRMQQEQMEAAQRR